MTTLAPLQTLLGRIRKDGMSHTLRLAAGRLRSEFVARGQDARRGISTAQEVADRELGFADPENHAYVATDYEVFIAAMKRIAVRPGEDVFVDFGSGKGRAVMLAAELPFRRVIGVEFSPQLHEVALRNLRAARGLKCRDVELVLADASLWQIPHDANVLFFFNPFEGEVLAKVFENIRRSLADAPRAITIIYVRADKFFERQIFWQHWLVRTDEIPCSDGKVAIYRNKL